MKYTDTQIGFQEFPDEISLLINISNCPFHCSGCHSPELWEDIGVELTETEMFKLLNKNEGITTIGLMGGNPEEICELAIKLFHIDFCNHTYKIGWYWGGENIPSIILNNIEVFDFIKIGPYKKELGGLDNPNTNQKFYHIENGQLVDWTYKFWKHGKK